MTIQPDLNEITRAGLIVYWVSCTDLNRVDLQPTRLALSLDALLTSALLAR